MANTKRKDKSRKVLRKGESQRPDGTYQFRWTDENRKRHCIYARNLDDLRYKEDEIDNDKKDGIKAEARYTSLNDMYELWRDLKRGIKNNTFENYKYMYETFVRNQIGSQFIMSIKKTDIKRYYNSLVDERHLKPATIDSIHTVLHQVFEMAVDDDYIRSNPTDNVLRELKKSHCFKTEKRRALTKPEQKLLGLHCEATVDGYTDFIFVNRFGQPQHQATLNKAIRRIIRNCNDKQFLESENPEVLLPHFSCHSLRHTFTTRMCEAGVNVKVIQDALGHKDVSTTLNIYTDVTKELRKSEFEGLELQFNQ